MTEPDAQTYAVIIGDIDQSADLGTDPAETTVFEGSLQEAEESFWNYAHLVPAEHEWVKLRKGGPGGEIVQTFPATG